MVVVCNMSEYDIKDVMAQFSQEELEIIKRYNKLLGEKLR